MPPTSFGGGRPLLAGLVVATTAVGVVLAARLMLGFVLGGRAPIMLFLLAVVLSAYFAGVRAGAMAMVLSAIVGVYFLIEPVYGFLPIATADAVRLVMFILVAGSICVVIGLLQRGQASGGGAEAGIHAVAASFRASAGWPVAVVIAAAAVALVLVVRLALEPLMSGRAPMILLLLAVVLSGYLAGARSALAATILGAVIGTYFLLEPAYRFGPMDAADNVRLLIFAVVGVSISGIVGRLQQSELRTGAAEAALNVSAATFRALADTIAQLAWMADERGIIFWYNRRWLEYTGQTLEQAQREGWLALVHPDHAERVRQTLMEAMSSGRAWEETFPMRGRDGAYRWFLSRAVPLGDQIVGGRVRWIATSTDITERVRADEALRGTMGELRRAEEQLAHHNELLHARIGQTRAELERSHEALRVSERMASLGTLAAGLGHDVGNLIVPMRIWLDSLDQANPAEESHKLVEMLRRSVEYLQNLTAGLRLLSLDPEDPWTSEPTTQLGAWWRQAEPLMRDTLPPGTKMSANMQDCEVAMPRHVLTQAVFNLVQNAADALAGREDGSVDLLGTSDGSLVRIAVTDNGPGMTAQTRAHSVEPFFTTKMRTRATGLGLALVHNAAIRAGGRLEIQSEPGRGSAFTLLIPAARTPDDRPKRQPVATVSVRNERLAALATALLEPYRVERSSMPAPGSRLWIADESAAAEDVRRFVESGQVQNGGAGDGGPKAIVLSDTGVEAHPAIVHLSASPQPGEIRDAIRSIMSQEHQR